MSEAPDSEIPFELAADEIASVESFRKLNDTAVLTIMFTDIVGFTQLTDERGERFSNEARRLHDEVLVGTITEGNAGLVVKHIGDAVMAVFSEPSTAVERALAIHQRLEEMVRVRPDIGHLEVKIGLDMGQVTVEGAVDVDVFGRHVNRASRIQGLAAGGQVFMSYTVFDSARGWLVGPASDRYEWTSHGRYALKGVSSPVEVFEVTDPERAPLRTPAGGKRVRSVPSVAWAAAFVLLGVTAAVLIPRFSRAEVWLVDYAPTLSYLDGSTDVLLDGTSDQSDRRLLADVSPGTHILHYDVADPVRFYAEVDVVRGENHLSPEFFESRLPTLYRFVSVGDGPTEASREGSYVVYDREGRRIEHQARVTVTIAVTTSPSEPNTAESELSWALELDGSPIADVTRTYSHALDATENREDDVELYADEYHRYWAHVRLVRGTTHLEINGAFLQP